MAAPPYMVNVRGSLLVAPFWRIRTARQYVAVLLWHTSLEWTHRADFATSLSREGKALVALRGGKALPDSALNR